MLIYVNGNLKTGKATLINYFLKGKGFTLINYSSTSTLTTELNFDKFEDFFNFITVNYDKNFIFSGNLSFEELTELK
jgi:archaellum biogenesis ATPase FlaH